MSLTPHKRTLESTISMATAELHVLIDHQKLKFCRMVEMQACGFGWNIVAEFWKCSAIRAGMEFAALTIELTNFCRHGASF